jgi:hypothetical protein
MRWISLWFVVAVCVSLCCPALVRQARAGGEPDTQPSPQPDPPDKAYTYGITFTESNEERPAPDPSPPTNDAGTTFLTFYDVQGYVPGTAAGPAGWTVQIQMTGYTPPGVAVVDDPNVVNITFEDSSAPSTPGPSQLGTFSFDSIYPDEQVGQYAYEDDNATTGATEAMQGTLLLPAVPEPCALGVTVGVLAAGMGLRWRARSTAG